jgi:hypothetical protein
LGVQPGRRVQDRYAVAHQLAVCDHRQLNCLYGIEVDCALLICAHEVRNADHGDVVNGFQAAHAGAFGDIAHVVVAR